jgi:hypothetical protein
VKALSSSPSATKKKKKIIKNLSASYIKLLALTPLYLT